MGAGDIGPGLSLLDVDRVLAHIEHEIATEALDLDDAVQVIRKARLGVALARINVETEAMLAAAANEASGDG